jgi:hypothetical protein
MILKLLMEMFELVRASRVYRTLPITIPSSIATKFSNIVTKCATEYSNSQG